MTQRQKKSTSNTVSSIAIAKTVRNVTLQFLIYGTKLREKWVLFYDVN